MAKQINLRLLNFILVSSFVSLCIYVIRLDFQNFNANGGTSETFIFWYLSTMHIPKYINIVISCCTAILFFGIAIKYNHIRKQKTNKYLANIILYSLDPTLSTPLIDPSLLRSTPVRIPVLQGDTNICG